MDKNIFEGASVGNKFITRDGEVLRFLKGDTFHMYFWSDKDERVYCYNVDGTYPHWGNETTHPLDIVDKQQEGINEEKLDELAKQNCPTSGSFGAGYIEGFIDGYHKAMEE